MPYLIITICLLIALIASIGLVWELAQICYCDLGVADGLDKALRDNRREMNEGLKNATDSINKQIK